MPDLLDEEIRMVGNAIARSVNHHRWAFWYDPQEQNPTIYWLEGPWQQGTPHTPITLLLQTLVNSNTREKRKIHEKTLRTGRIYISSTMNPTVMCRGMAEFIGVGITLVPPMEQQVQGVVHGVNPYAKQPREEYGNIQTFRKLSPQAILPQIGFRSFPTWPLGEDPNFGNLESETKESGFHTVHRIYMMIAFALVAARHRDHKVSGHNIGAVIVAPSGKLISWGVNTRYENYTFHAEVNALQSYYARRQTGLPRGTRIYTTLKPCKMCAGMIRMACEVDGEIKVFYGQEDSGGHACNTALDLIPNIQQQLGASHAKALSIHGTGIYFNSNKKFGRTTENLGRDLEAKRQQVQQNIRTKFLKSGDALSLFDKSLQSVDRKLNKYKLRQGNENVRKVLNHLRPFILDLRLDEYKLSSTDELVQRLIKANMLEVDSYDDGLSSSDDMSYSNDDDMVN
jgi:tRNA(Arg) A34 adenosine deaminase TadA